MLLRGLQKPTSTPGNALLSLSSPKPNRGLDRLRLVSQQSVVTQSKQYTSPFFGRRRIMKAALRTLAAVLIAMFVAFVLVNVVELFSTVVHPFPADFKGTTEEICRHVEKYPQWILAVVVPVWAGTALLSTWIARRIGTPYSSEIVGLALMSALVFNLTKLPYPIWFNVANLLAIPAAIIAGSWLAIRRHTAGSVEVKPAADRGND
jgi:hypothetical protein